MIIEEINNNLIKRYSNNFVKILNTTTMQEYDEAVDLVNEERIRRGLEPYIYIETSNEIDKEEQPNNSEVGTSADIE